MDFHSLSRKELQALCKKNKIPANMTNVAMADALNALEMVELINPTNNDTQQSPEKTTIAEPRTAARTSTRRKPINVEPESSQTLTRTRRTTRRTVAEEAEQENQNLNLLETPAMTTTRIRAPAASARQKIEVQLVEDEEDEKSNVPETPAMQSSRKKAPAVPTKKDEKSVQRVYGTRQSVRLLEKNLAELSLKEKRGIEAVKIEGLGKETEEVEQNENSPAAGDSEVLSCQDKDISPENESETNVKFQEDKKNNGHEADVSEVLSSQNLDELMENESERENEIQEEKNTNDQDVNESFVLVQKLDESLDNECEMKHKTDVDKKSVDNEWEAYVLCQANDQLMTSGNAEKLGVQVENEINDNEIIDCNLTVEMGSKSCTNLDNILHANENDCPDGTFSLQKETSKKATDINCESINENGPDIITEDSEMLIADLNPEIEKKMNDNQEFFIEEPSDDNSAFVGTETENNSVDVTDSLTPEVTEVMGKSSEMNLLEDGGDDLHSNPVTEKISNGNDLAEVPDDSESDDSESDVPDDSESDVPDYSESDEGESEAVSDDCDSKSGSDEVPDDSKLDEESDGRNSIEASDVIVEVSGGIQENDDIGKIQKAPVLSEADYGNSQSRNELESPKFHIQHEKCEASDYLVKTDNVSVIETKESDSDKSSRSPTSLKQICPYQPLISLEVTDGTVSSPFASNTIQGQFPRPTEPTPRKSSAKKPTTVQKNMDPDIINKENIDTSGRKVVPKKNKVKKGVVNADMSLRQLSKMLKEKLIIANKNNNEGENVGTWILTLSTRRTLTPVAEK